MKLNKLKPFASFVVVQCKGGYAATTRAADKGEQGKIGLAGGKIDKGETSRQAVVREASEEGWDVSGVSLSPVHTAIVDGQLVHWFSAKSAVIKTDFKEKGRIQPIVSNLNQLANSGYGNDFLIDFI
jgi:hypothetical protein